jgi:hypothetical protein
MNKNMHGRTENNIFLAHPLALYAGNKRVSYSCRNREKTYNITWDLSLTV